MKTNNFMYQLTRTISFKFLLVGIMSLFMLIPAAWIRSIIVERQERQTEVLNEVSASWGGSQTLAGPILTIPYKKVIEIEGKETKVQTEYAHFLPSILKVSSNIDPEIRYRGIFKIAVYNSTFQSEGSFEWPDLESLGIDLENADLKNAIISLGITDMRGVKNEVNFQLQDAKLEIIPGVPVRDLFSSGLHCKVDLSKYMAEQKMNFNYSLSLNGSNSLNFYPIGKLSEFTVKSSWTSPSFEGEFLPVTRELTNEGFTASWLITNLNRNYPQAWVNKSYSIETSGFGIGLLLPVSHYQQADRSVKYAIMFLGLTFLLFLLIEILNKKRLHPIQYFLTGLSLSVFYILLLSISEQIGFAYAYLCSSIAVVGLISFYIHGSYRNMKYTSITGSLLALLYGFLYVILQLQDYSLLIGSIGLFIVLGTFMYLTRNINWYHEDSETEIEEGV